MRVIGHRGAAGHAPENTLAALRYALDCGVDMVEIDVRLVDDALIVLHDETLARTTSGTGHYKALALAQLRALDAGQGERIPLLEEVLALIDGRIGLNVEVKEAGIAAAVITCLEYHTRARPAWRQHLLLSSFDVTTSAALAAQRGTMAFGLLYQEPFDAALTRACTLGARSLHMALAKLDSDAVAQAHARGIEVLVYTVNEPAAIARCRVAAVDGVFSDFPERVIASNRAAMAGRR